MKFNTAIRTGDTVTWNAPQFTGGSFYRGRCQGAKYSGDVQLSGRVIRHSYGEKTGQHTFTILLTDGSKKRVKGRNLYPNLVEHTLDLESPDRQ